MSFLLPKSSSPVSATIWEDYDDNISVNTTHTANTLKKSNETKSRKMENQTSFFTSVELAIPKAIKHFSVLVSHGVLVGLTDAIIMKTFHSFLPDEYHDAFKYMENQDIKVQLATRIINGIVPVSLVQQEIQVDGDSSSLTDGSLETSNTTGLSSMDTHSVSPQDAAIALALAIDIQNLTIDENVSH